MFVDTGVESRRFNRVEKKRLGGNSHRTVDHTHSILIDDDRLDPVREELQEEDYEATALDGHIDVSDMDSDEDPDET